MEYCQQVEDSLYFPSDAGYPLRTKWLLSDWSREDIGLKDRTIDRLASQTSTGSKELEIDTLFKQIKSCLIEKNRGVLVSSVTAKLSISFEKGNQTYSLIQYSPGGLNLSWDIWIGDKHFMVISPELNNLIYQILPNQMRAKKQLLKYLEVEELANCF